MLTEKEIRKIKEINLKRRWTLSPAMVKAISDRHRNARLHADQHTMELAEYWLSEVNYHEEQGLLMEGKYEELERLLQEEM